MWAAPKTSLGQTDFPLQTQLTFQCRAKSEAANICKHNVTLGGSKMSAILLAKALSDKQPAAAPGTRNAVPPAIIM